MPPPYVIVWDLDDTLGNFEALENSADELDAATVQVRPGLAECLRTLCEHGFIHTVLTLAMPLYAEVALRGTNLRGFFERVECLGQRPKGDAVGIAAAFGLYDTAVADRLLFVGNHPFDAPQDPRVVFHLELHALNRPADLLTRLVLYLREQGDGSLQRGFHRLRNRQGWWRWPWRGSSPKPVPSRCRVPHLGQLLLLSRPDACPVIGFENPPDGRVGPTEFRLAPNELVAQVLQERGG